MVHSTEWTTGSRLFGAFDPVSALFPGASGPLGGVDHWLTPYRDFRPSFRLSPSLLSRLPALSQASHQLFISGFDAKRPLFGYLYMKKHLHNERRMRHATAYLGFLLLSTA